MAETTVQHTDYQPELPVEPLVKGKSGRNKPPKLPNGGIAEETPDDQPQELMNSLHNYSASEWERVLILYGYRVEPITDRKLTGNKNYIRKWNVPIDVDDIKREFGSGVYKMVLNRLDETTRRQNTIGVQYVSILDEDFPPKIPIGEWVDDERNRDWWWAKPKLIAKQNEAMRNANSGNETAQVVQAVTDAIQKLRPEADDEEKKTLLTMVLSQMQATNSQMVDLAKRSSSELMPLVTAIIGMQKNSGTDLQGIAALISALRPKSDDTMTTLLMNLLTKAQEDARLAMEKLMERMDRRTGGGGAQRDNGVDWAGIARDLGGQLFQTLDSGFKVWLAVQGQKQMRPGARPPQQSAPGLPPGTPQETNQPMTPEQQQNALKALDAQFGPMFDSLVPDMMEIFRDPQGVGMEFRDEVFLVQFGKFAYSQIQQLDVRTIVGVIEMRKQTAPPNIQRELQDFQPDDKVMKFIGEFLSNTPWEPPSDEQGHENVLAPEGF